LTCINRYNTGIPVYEEKGTIGNDSATAWLRIGWPIVRDGSRVTSAGVQVIDLNSAQYIECKIIRAFHSGDQTIIRYSYVGRSTEDRVGSDGVGGTGWVWGSLDELGSPGTYSHYVVSCIIPPRAEGVSKMVTYRVTED
jgi:hypothetical protein